MNTILRGLVFFIPRGVILRSCACGNHGELASGVQRRKQRAYRIPCDLDSVPWPVCGMPKERLEQVS